MSGAPADSMLLVDTGRRGEREWCSLDGSVIMMPEMTRRDFVRLGAGAAVTGAVVKATLLEPPVLAAQTAATGRKIRFVSIGTGIRGCDLLRSARKVPTGELVATADLYEMHRKAGLEAYGQEVPTGGERLRESRHESGRRVLLDDPRGCAGPGPGRAKEVR